MNCKTTSEYSVMQQLYTLGQQPYKTASVLKIIIIYNHPLPGKLFKLAILGFPWSRELCMLAKYFPQPVPHLVTC